MCPSLAQCGVFLAFEVANGWLSDHAPMDRKLDGLILGPAHVFRVYPDRWLQEAARVDLAHWDCTGRAHRIVTGVPDALPLVVHQQVGIALVLGEGIHIQAKGWSNWSQSVSSAVAIGPVPSRSSAAQSVSLDLDTISVGTRSLYLGAVANSIPMDPSAISRTCQAITYLTKRYGTVVHVLHADGVWLAHLLPGQAAEPTIGPRMLSQSESLVARTLNLGGASLGTSAWQSSAVHRSDATDSRYPAATS